MNTEQRDLPRRRRTGPAPLAPEDRRTHCVSVRLADAELAQLDAVRATIKMQRGEYLRAAALHRLPPTIPAINREAWASLARVAANLNQYQKQINAGLANGHAPDVIEALAEQVGILRRQMIGARESGAADESENQ